MRMISIEEIVKHLSKYKDIEIFREESINRDERYLKVAVKGNNIAYIYTYDNKIILQEFAYTESHESYYADQRDITYILSKFKYKRFLSIDPHSLVPFCLDEILGITDECTVQDEFKIVVNHLKSIKDIKVVDTESENFYGINVQKNCIGFLSFDGDNILLHENVYGKDSYYFQRDREHLNILLNYLKCERLLSLDGDDTLPFIVDKVLGIRYAYCD